MFRVESGLQRVLQHPILVEPIATEKVQNSVIVQPRLQQQILVRQVLAGYRVSVVTVSAIAELLEESEPEFRRQVVSDRDLLLVEVCLAKTARIRLFPVELTRSNRLTSCPFPTRPKSA